MASTRVEVEDIATTKSEKLLATVLTGFLLVGLVWVYFHIDAQPRLNPFTQVSSSRADGIALRDYGIARDRVTMRLGDQYRKSATLTERREDYRTALDEGRRDATLARRYQASRAAFARARRRVAAARREVARLAPSVPAARRRHAAAQLDRDRRVEADRRHAGRVSLARRLALVLLWLGASYALLAWLRRRGSRWLLAGMAAVAAIALLTLVMAVDYLTDYVDVTDLGVLVLAIAGALLTVVAFAFLQRYLARRLPERRVRHRECPFCGYPTRDVAHCEGCGRDVVAECASCHEPRRVGTRHCRACGAA